MISLFGSNVGKEELNAVKDCFDRQWMGIGPKVAEFEKKISEKANANGFVFLNSGSNSLVMALKVMSLPEGSEVILPSFTWITCASAVVLNKLKPVFCDVDPETGNVRAKDIEEKITKNTSAVMVVHYGGKPVDMDSIMALGFPVLEDAAHAIDSTYKGKHCGAIGEAGIFSFDAVKNITTGEGGGLLHKDPQKLELARKLRYCGISKSGFEASATKQRWWEYEISDFFPKMLNTDIAAAIGLEQLKKLPTFQKRRREIWNRYTETFTKESWANNWLLLPKGEESHEQHSFFTYYIRLQSGDRDKLAKFLFDRGVYTSLRYHPLHLNKIYGSMDVRLKNTEELNEIALNIPIHHRMTDDETSQVIEGLKAFRQSKI